MRKLAKKSFWRAMTVGFFAGFVALMTLALTLEGSQFSLSGITAAPSRTQPIVQSEIKGYGFATTLRGLAPEQLEAKLTGMKAAGATWVRYDLSWAGVQSNGSSTYDWSEYDAIIAAVNKHGLKSVVTIGFTPEWARPANCKNSEMCAPADANAYGKFAGIAADRYRDQGINVWSLWNEPNISYRFKPAADAGKYTAMVKSAYAAIKHANAKALVVAGETAPAGTHGGDVSPSDFTRALYNAGIYGSFDIFAAHPYTYPETPATGNAYNAWGQMMTMHDIMADHGDEAKPLWITEFGAPTGGPGEPSATGKLTYPQAEYVTEGLQAQILSEAAQIYFGKSWSGLFMWYDYQDAGTKHTTSENFYGLVRADGSHKPAYDAFAAAARQ